MKNTKSVLRYPFLLVAAVLALSTLTCTITIGGQTPAPPSTPILLLPPTVTPTVQPPQVTFTGDRTVVKGECATLQWSVQGDGVLAVKLNGQPVNPSGQQQVCPQESTLYTLSVETGTAVIQREVRIFVEAGPLPLPPPPTAPGPSVAADPYADHVVNFTPGNPANPDLGNAQSVLGPPDFNESALSGFLTLGVGGSVTVEFVDNLAVDGPGPDLEIVGDPGNDEQWIAEVSADGVSYRSFGKVWERATLDLAKVGLTSARCVRLTDDGDPSGGISPGSELDAVVALNSAAPGAAPPPGEQPPGGGPPGEPQISFTADRTSLKSGECTTLHWSVQGGYSVELNKQPVERASQRQVCPNQTTTYQLGVDAGERFVYDELVISVESVAQPPPQPPPQQPPSPQTVDLAVTDLYPDHLPQGKVWVRITNNGPASLSNVSVEIKCNALGTPLGGQLPLQHVQPPQSLTVSLNSGQTKELDTGITVDTTQYSYKVTCGMGQAQGYSDPNMSNNNYSEDISSPAPPPLTPILLPSADPAVTDLYPDSLPTGKVWGRITNHGPDSLTNTDIQLSCSTVRTEYVGGAQTTQAVAPRTITVNLNAGQTAAFDTHIPIEDSTKYWYKVTCSIQVWAANLNTNTSNDSYTESIPPPP